MSSDNLNPAGRVRAWVACGLLVLAAGALLLRAWGANATFQSGDYASMPYMVTHWFGLSWIIAHIHGPLLPGMVWLFAKAATTLGIGMNEALWRLPLGLVGSLHVPVTYLLMRRLRADRPVALLAAALTAVLPSLTSDARYPWGYETLAVCIGTLAIWAFLRDLDQPSRRGEWLAGGLLGLYALSHLVIHAVPTIIVVAVLATLGWRAGLRRLLRLSVLAPVAGAVACTAYAWFALDGGILGRMARHVGHGTLDPAGSTPLDLAFLWVNHLGPIWATFCGLGVLVGLAMILRGDRRGLPGLWAVVYVLPLMLLLDLDKIGRTTVYQVQGTYAGMLAGCMLLQFTVERVRVWDPSPRPAAGAIIAMLGLAFFGCQLLGSVCNLFLEARWPVLAGTVDYGRVVPDPGHKAAGWYIREHVPADAVILATHGTIGMEYPVAVYYTGRHIAAAEDTTEEQECRIIDTIGPEVDVAIVEPRFARKFEEELGFTTPVRVYRDGELVLLIAARDSKLIPRMDVNLTEANRAFDRDYAPRRVPQPIPTIPRTAQVNQRILALLADARRAAPIQSVTVGDQD